MQPLQGVEQWLGDESPPPELHQAVQRRAHDLQSVNTFGTGVHAQVQRPRRRQARGHLRNVFRFGLAIHSGFVRIRPARHRQRNFREIAARGEGRQKHGGEIEVFNPGEIECSRDGQAHGSLAGLAEIFYRQRVEFSGGAGKYIRLRGRPIRGGVAETAGPGEARSQRHSIQRHRGLHIDDVGGVEFQLLRDFQVAVAPGQRNFRGSVQNGAGVRDFARRGDFKQRAICSRFLLRIVERKRKGPASGLLGGVGVDQIERARRFVIVGEFLELPASHHAAAVGNLHAIQIAFDDDGTFRACGAHGHGSGRAPRLFSQRVRKWKQLPGPASKQDSWSRRQGWPEAAAAAYR